MSRSVRSAQPRRPALPSLRAAWRLLGIGPLLFAPTALADASLPVPHDPARPAELPPPRTPNSRGKQVSAAPLDPREQPPGDGARPGTKQSLGPHPGDPRDGEGRSNRALLPRVLGRMPMPRNVAPLSLHEGKQFVVHPHQPWEPCEVILGRRSRIA